MIDRQVEPLRPIPPASTAWIWPAVLAVVAVTGASIATRHGPALSPDSVTYLSAARNLAAGHGYRDFTGQANTTFPPGYAALLAFANRVGLSLSTSARVLNVLSFASIVLLTWALLRRYRTSSPILIGTTAVVALSPALLEDSRHLWSEPLFCALVVSFLIVLEQALDRPESWTSRVAVSGALAGGAFLFRYAAVALILSGVITLAWSARTDRRAAGARVATFVASATFIPALWVLRNATTGTAYVLGPRMSDPAGPDVLAGRLLSSLESLFLPTTARSIFVLMAVPLVFLVLNGVYTTLRHRSTAGNTEFPSVVPAGTLVAVYVGLVVVSGKAAGSSIDSRILSPIYVPIVITGALLLQRGIHTVKTSPEQPRVAGGARLLLATALLGLLTFSATWFTNATLTGGQLAQGYRPISRRSPLALAVRSLPPRAVITTNRPWALYVATGRQPITPLPATVYPSASLTPPTPDGLTDQACSRPVYLAWYGVARQTTPSLVDKLDLTPTTTVPDGSIYAVDSSSDRCATGHLATRKRTHADERESHS